MKPPAPVLPGKVCVIAGTGGSMGRAAALGFSREGASVVGCDLDVGSAEATVQLVRREGGDDGVVAALPSQQRGRFLASGESSYVTGVDIVVDGGMRVW